MISQEAIQKLSVQYQTSEFPNVVREYFQHLFLSVFYKIDGAENILFKGGTALRVIYGSPRFSEDLDFSIFNIESRRQKDFIESTLTKVLAEIEKIGVKVELGPKPGPTTRGYYSDATLKIHDYPPALMSINISSRNGRGVKGEVVSIVSDFVPAYNVFQLPQEKLVAEKIFAALLTRRKARDFYDLYFIMRKGLLTIDQKKKLGQHKAVIILAAEKIDFREELGALLPKNQQALIGDFKKVLANELNRQLGEI